MALCKSFATIAVAAILLTGCGGNQPSAMSGAASGITPTAHKAATGALCPANPKGTGILPDGDFSQATDPLDTFNEYGKSNNFAPGWTVSQRTIDLVGSNGWTPNGFKGYCSINLDGGGAGAIASAPFPTTKGTLYYVTFVLSGDGSCESKLKKFKIETPDYSEIFGWDARNGQDIQHNVFQAQTWMFVATHSSSRLIFRSLDGTRYLQCGTVIANISVTTTPQI
jgi:hypothetical protein